MPGKSITVQQVRLYMTHRKQGETQATAGAKGGMSERTGRRIEAGEGSIGRLLADEEIYEDIREFVRELKRRPWRIIWKE